MEVENVSGVCLTSGRTVEQERHCTVCNGVLGEVIIHDEDVLALGHEIFSHSRARIRGYVLEGSRVARRCAYNYGIIHSAVLFERIYYLSNCRGLLSDSDIDTDNVLALLIYYSIHCDRGLTGLAVADDELTLTSAYREH